jgi:hypothetical protein
MSRELRCYDYVNRSYPRVREAIGGDAQGIFHRATQAAASRAEALVSTLRASVGPIDIAADIAIEVDPPVDERNPLGGERTLLGMRWRAVRGATLFPVMEATLAIYPLTASETQLELTGVYRPPLGALGTVLDGLAMSRVAEASVLRFVTDVARYLGKVLAEDPRAPQVV